MTESMYIRKMQARHVGIILALFTPRPKVPYC